MVNGILAGAQTALVEECCRKVMMKLKLAGGGLRVGKGMKQLQSCRIPEKSKFTIFSESKLRIWPNAPGKSPASGCPPGMLPKSHDEA